LALHTHISSEGRTEGKLVDAVQKPRLTPPT